MYLERVEHARVTEHRKADVSVLSTTREHPVKFTFDMLACFARGSGLDFRGGKRHRIGLGMDGHHSYMANASPGMSRHARDRDPFDRVFPECVFYAQRAFFTRVSTRDSPPPATRLPTRTEEEEQVHEQLSALKDHLLTRYARVRQRSVRVRLGVHDGSRCTRHLISILPATHVRRGNGEIHGTRNPPRGRTAPFSARATFGRSIETHRHRIDRTTDLLPATPDRANPNPKQRHGGGVFTRRRR